MVIVAPVVTCATSQADSPTAYRLESRGNTTTSGAGEPPSGAA
jgi:hypothetical protein